MNIFNYNVIKSVMTVDSDSIRRYESY